MSNYQRRGERGGGYGGGYGGGHGGGYGGGHGGGHGGGYGGGHGGGGHGGGYGGDHGGGYGGGYGGYHAPHPHPSMASVASAAAAAAAEGEDASRVEQVVIEGLVVLKIAKHYYEEQMSGNRIVQGLLLGLVQDTRLEVTNCFPFPRQSEEDDAANAFGIAPVSDFDATKYQLDIQKNFRQLNADYLTVGWYQSSAGAEFLTKEFVESQFHYQIGVLDAVALVYNPQKTSRGQLAFRAFRLSAALVRMMREDEQLQSQQRMKELMISHSSLLQELPVVVRNSHLINVLLAEMEDSVSGNAFSGLSLAMGSQLERQLKSLSTGCEVILQESSKYLNYQRTYKKYEKALQDQKLKVAYENQQRAQRGEEALSEDVIDKTKLPKMGNPPVALDPVLTSAQLHQFTSELLETVGQTYGKLMLAEGIQYN